MSNFCMFYIYFVGTNFSLSHYVCVCACSIFILLKVVKCFFFCEFRFHNTVTTKCTHPQLMRDVTQHTGARRRKAHSVSGGVREEQLPRQRGVHHPVHAHQRRGGPLAHHIVCAAGARAHGGKCKVRTHTHTAQTRKRTSKSR